MHASEKRLNEMNRLTDMLHFPAAVNAGATLNVMVTVLLTWWLAPKFWGAAAGIWLAVVLALNLAPVVLLRLSLTPATEYPTLARMNFVHDQHKFSDWVYVAASANMAFWVLLAWTVAWLYPTVGVLLALELVAFLATSSPVLLRKWLQPQPAR